MIEEHSASQRTNYIIIGTLYLIFLGYFLWVFLDAFSHQNTELGLLAFRFLMAFPSSILLVAAYSHSAITTSARNPKARLVLLLIAYFLVSISMNAIFCAFILYDKNTLWTGLFLTFSYFFAYRLAITSKTGSGWWYVVAFGAPIYGLLGLLYLIGNLLSSFSSSKSSTSASDPDYYVEPETTLSVRDSDRGRDVTLTPLDSGHFVDENGSRWTSDDGGNTASKDD